MRCTIFWTDSFCRKGTLVRAYPLLQRGRVVADVEIAGLPDSFTDTRLLVRLPVGKREALLVPQDSIVARSGLDFVGVRTGERGALRSIVPRKTHDVDLVAMVEIMIGLAEEDVIVTILEIDREREQDAIAWHRGEG